MQALPPLNRNLITFAIPLSLLGLTIFVMKMPVVRENSAMSLAVTIDLLLTIPLVYFLLIRKRKIPKTTVVPVAIVGMLAGLYFLPKENQTYLELFKSWALPLIEIGVLSFISYKVHKAIKTYKSIKNKTPDFFNSVKNVCFELFPKAAANALATEITMFYYGFVNWKKQEITPNEFTYHEKNGTPSLLLGFILVVGIEATAMHFLLAKWSNVAAWVLTGLSMYSALQLFGFARSLSKRFTSIENNTLHLRYGIMSETNIDVNNIDSVEVSSKELETNKLTVKLSPLGELEDHNVVIRLKEENNLLGLYGIKKTYKTIALYIDEPNQFKERIEEVNTTGMKA